MTVVKVLTLFVVLAVLRPTMQTAPVLIGAHSAASLWQDNVHRPFWEAITTFLVSHVINRPGFGTSYGDEAKIERLVNEINAGVYNFRIGEENEVWAVFTEFLCNFEVPTLDSVLATALANSGPSAPKVNEAFAKSINGLFEEARNFIADLCTFLTMIDIYYIDKLYEYNGKPFLYNALTFSNVKDKKDDKHKRFTLPNLFSKRNNKKAEVALHDHNKPLDVKYYAYDYMSTFFGTNIVRKDGYFLMAKVFGNKNVRDCWGQWLFQNFLTKTLNFLMNECSTVEGILRDNRGGNETLLREEQEKMDKGLTDFLKKENCMRVGRLFRPCLQSIEELIIPAKLANEMRLASSNPADVLKNLPGFLVELSKLRIENRILISKVIQLAHVLFENGSINKWDQGWALATMIDPCLSRVDKATTIEEGIKAEEIKNNKYPILTYMIENWGKTVHFNARREAFEMIVR